MEIPEIVTLVYTKLVHPMLSTPFDMTDDSRTHSNASNYVDKIRAKLTMNVHMKAVMAMRLVFKCLRNTAEDDQFKLLVVPAHVFFYRLDALSVSALQNQRIVGLVQQGATAHELKVAALVARSTFALFGPHLSYAILKNEFFLWFTAETRKIPDDRGKVAFFRKSRSFACSLCVLSNSSCETGILAFLRRVEQVDTDSIQACVNLYRMRSSNDKRLAGLFD